MTKNTYLFTGSASFIAFFLLIVMYFSWPVTEYSLYDVILYRANFTSFEKASFIKAIGINYAIDSVFILSWIVAWFGLFLHFKSLNVKLIGICLGLSLLGALLDIAENSISFTLLIGNHNKVEHYLLIHSIIRGLSYLLPVLASFLLAIIILKQKGFPSLLLKLTGILGILFAAPGIYIQYFSLIPDYWFGLLFLSIAIFLFANYKKFKK
jgi:hypothetical protein